MNSENDSEILTKDIVDVITKNINTELNKRHWARNEVSNLSDLSSGTMSDWFTFKKIPTLKSLAQICEVFDMSVSRLTAKDKSEALDAQKIELLEEFERLTEIQRERLLDFVKHAM